MGFHGDFMVTLMGYDMIYPPVSSNIAMGISPIIRHFKEKNIEPNGEFFPSRRCLIARG
jgi:hypothetical protein